MAIIKIDELADWKELTEEMAAQVKGGAIYIEYEGVDGSVESRSSVKIQEACANGTF